MHVLHPIAEQHKSSCYKADPNRDSINIIARPNWRGNDAIVFAEYAAVPEDTVIKVFDRKLGHLSEVPDSKGLIYPVVSPDGRYVASTSADDKKLKVYDFTAKSWQEFVSPAGTGVAEWSSDSRYVYFDNGLAADPGVFRLRLADQKAEKVASLKNFRRANWGNLPWFGLTPEDEPLVMRDVGSQEVYALDFKEP